MMDKSRAISEICVCAGIPKNEIGKRMKARRGPQDCTQDGSDAGDRLIGSARAPDRFAPEWLEFGLRGGPAGGWGAGWLKRPRKPQSPLALPAVSRSLSIGAINVRRDQRAVGIVDLPLFVLAALS